MQQQALGWLRWTPDAFWSATLAEVDNAVQGYLEDTRGIEPRGSRDDLYDELKRIGDEAVAREKAEEAADER